jgi:hypothetical protein
MNRISQKNKCEYHAQRCVTHSRMKSTSRRHVQPWQKYPNTMHLGAVLTKSRRHCKQDISSRRMGQQVRTRDNNKNVIEAIVRDITLCVGAPPTRSTLTKDNLLMYFTLH